jgi:hypothetical protein
MVHYKNNLLIINNLQGRNGNQKVNYPAKFSNISRVLAPILIEIGLYRAIRARFGE